MVEGLDLFDPPRQAATRTKETEYGRRMESHVGYRLLRLLTTPRDRHVDGERVF